MLTIAAKCAYGLQIFGRSSSVERLWIATG
jgi:hypothetical protein